MIEVLEYLYKHSNSNPDSPISKYKTVLESDLAINANLTCTDVDSDVEPIDLDGSVDPPSTLQRNLGQGGQLYKV